MAAVAQNIKHGWVWALCLLIFFFNTVTPLPEGVTLVLLFTPLWVYLLYAEKKLKIAGSLLIPLLLYIPVHLFYGVSIAYYLISATILVALIFFALAFYLLINQPAINLDLIFRDIAILNFLLVLASLPLLYTPFKEAVWYMIPISDNIKPIPRLKLFASEASHYSFALAPVTIYFYSRVLFFKTSRGWFTLLIITIPLILSFSLGVLSALFISGLVVACIFFKKVFHTNQRRAILLALILLSTVTFIISYHWFPGNPLFARIRNIISGQDTSSRGRTYEAFILANKIAGQKSYLWGVGPGQLKLLGRSIILEYYSYSKIPPTIRIPNVCAETIAYFGYVGFALRLTIEAFFFFKTKVYMHPFRLWLFVFVFIYQFTGSYVTNAAEYIIWILAFSNIFPEYINFKKEKNDFNQPVFSPGKAYIS